MHFLITLLLVPIFIGAQETPSSVLEKIDAVQRNYQSMGFQMEMKIENRGRTLLKTTAGVARAGDDSAFIEYTNPQDRGTRYLKLDQDMWIYSPDAQDVLKISGHLLRDSMMGSDISYNDVMDRGAYKMKYSPSALSSTNLMGEELFVLTLSAKDDKAPYARQDLFVQKNNYLIRKIVMYAKGRTEDRAIKEFSMDDYQKFGNVSVALHMSARDLRRNNSLTTISYQNIQIDPPINPQMFTRSYLER